MKLFMPGSRIHTWVSSTQASTAGAFLERISTCSRSFGAYKERPDGVCGAGSSLKPEKLGNAD